MRNYTKYILLLMVLLTIALYSCDKFSGSDDSITGAWRCREESGVDNYRQYTVTIYRAGAGYDSTYFVIYNFHNLGPENETYVQLRDTVVTILMNDYSASGKGYVSKDFKTIDWAYTILDEYVTALYYKN